jgi:hypothetical protein
MSGYGLAYLIGAVVVALIAGIAVATDEPDIDLASIGAFSFFLGLVWPFVASCAACFGIFAGFGWLMRKTANALSTL